MYLYLYREIHRAIVFLNTKNISDLCGKQEQFFLQKTNMKYIICMFIIYLLFKYKCII